MTGTSIAEKISITRTRLQRCINYGHTGVWRDTRRGWKVSVVKTLSLSVRSFMDSDLQTQACALTYRTLLAIVPALALLFAIGRGFGFQNLLTDRLYNLFPSQQTALQTAISFVDSYLAQASEGIFVGVGIVFLLWTLISLLGNVEASFNKIWHVESGRSILRKVTDYLAILLILPILMICSGGISLMMSTALKTLLPYEFLKPAVTMLFDFIGYMFTWLFFAGAYMLIPNARVKFINALLSGIIVGTAFQILQWLFLSGQMYVSKYNAIYGGFSFLPLLLIWLQLVWLITLIGALLCYASQNIGQFNFGDDIEKISTEYRREVSIAIMTIIARRFTMGQPPLTNRQLSESYGLPVRLVNELVIQLRDMGLVNFVETDGVRSEHPVQPAIDVSHLTVGELVLRMQKMGTSDFIPDFDTHYAEIIGISKAISTKIAEAGNATLLTDITIDINHNR